MNKVIVKTDKNEIEESIKGLFEQSIDFKRAHRKLSNALDSYLLAEQCLKNDTVTVLGRKMRRIFKKEHTNNTEIKIDKYSDGKSYQYRIALTGDCAGYLIAIKFTDERTILIKQLV